MTNLTDLPYTIRKNTKIAKFSVVNLEQSKFFKSVVATILSLILGGVPDRIAYMNELFGTCKTEQQSNTIRFSIPDSPGRTEYQTPIQALILNELNELKEKEKLNPLDNADSRRKFV